MPQIRDFVVIALLLTICLLAVYQKMEILAMTSILLLGTIVYRNPLRSFIDIIFKIVRHAQISKIGELQFTSEGSPRTNREAFTQHPEWCRMLLSGLSDEQLAILVAIFKEGKLRASDKENLRSLRDRGLLSHNQQTLLESTEVWLTALGEKAAKQILGTSRQRETLDQRKR